MREYGVVVCYDYTVVEPNYPVGIGPYLLIITASSDRKARGSCPFASLYFSLGRMSRIF